MRKEVIFAIILGLILGGVILYGIRLADSSAKEAISTTSDPTVTPSDVVSPTPSANLTIISPQDHAVINTSTIKIIGRALPNSDVAIHSSEDDILVTADSSGNFTADFTLTGGENVIQVTSLSKDSQTETLTFSVIYTTAKID